MSQEVADREVAPSKIEGARWMALIFNNDSNSVDEVVDVLMRATGCNLVEANMETWEAHMFGKAAVHFASLQECQRVCETLASIGLKTQICPEWND